jgi:hypothetical protein
LSFFFAVDRSLLLLQHDDDSSPCGTTAFSIFELVIIDGLMNGSISESKTDIDGDSLRLKIGEEILLL